MRSLVIILVLLMSLSAWGNRKGLGISIGNPTGFNGKYWLDKKTAVDGGLGF